MMVMMMMMMMMIMMRVYPIPHVRTVLDRGRFFSATLRRRRSIRLYLSFWKSIRNVGTYYFTAANGFLSDEFLP